MFEHLQNRMLKKLLLFAQQPTRIISVPLIYVRAPEPEREEREEEATSCRRPHLPWCPARERERERELEREREREREREGEREGGRERES